jgi:hypothetical protein
VITAMTGSLEAVRDIEPVVREGNFLVRMALAAILSFPKRRSVETHMAVRQLAIFRSVAGPFGDVSGIAELCPFHRYFDVSTL